jgi:signal-transduction protein with cAMP-binding, CBS, and nucleotidyltransferase domain
LKQKLAREVMREKSADVDSLPAVDGGANIFDVAVRMLNEKQSRLRVMEGEEVIGTLSMTDVLRAACAR